MDSFGCDPNTGEGMLATAERVAAQGGFSKAEIDAVTARRWEQYDRRGRLPEALDGPDHVQAQADELDADWGIRPALLETLEGLKAVKRAASCPTGPRRIPPTAAPG